VLLLLIGGIVIPLFGWVAGVVLLWASPVWTVREKLAGTLLVPGGLATVLVAAIALAEGGECTSLQQGGRLVEHCAPGASTATSVLHFAILAFLILAPIVTAIHLARRIRAVSG